MSCGKQFASGAVEDARQRFDAGDSIHSIASLLGVSGNTMRKYIRLWEWPARPAKGRKATRPVEAPDGDAIDTRRLARRVEATVRKQLASIEQRIGGEADPADAERDARVLASLVKSLAELARLDAAGAVAAGKSAGAGGRKGTGGADDDLTISGGNAARPPRDLAELREELAARLRHLRAGRDPDEADS